MAAGPLRKLLPSHSEAALSYLEAKWLEPTISRRVELNSSKVNLFVLKLTLGRDFFDNAIVALRRS